LTDAQGHTVDFRNTVIIMTSNIASEMLGRLTGSREEKLKAIMPELRRYFKPEFLNRIDEIIIFNPLGIEEIKGIVDLQLEGVRKALSERNIKLELTEAAREYLAREGYDPEFGARPLRRTIQRLIETPLSRMLIAGEIKEGDTVQVDYDGKELKFNVLEKKPA
ncbi:MAG: AAA family ATPase, partial [Candidatus Hydrothermae bacterium]|nr:AAA family ATPase [Candidatus Hydrothermae bacterium]